RGLKRKNAGTIGNFYVDLTRSTLYVLLPLSFVLALVLVSQGVPQNFSAYTVVQLLEPIFKNGQWITTQIIPQGPIAAMEAIKMLGSNGGGFFGTNSAFPLENPTMLSNLVEMISIMLIPMGACGTSCQWGNDAEWTHRLFAREYGRQRGPFWGFDQFTMVGLYDRRF
ncbi:MAG: potassium-transporting ATPase subunit KdpA, partial [Firmicutes bacterium]|nr:potassium-transporting ATPase subunit KdpA [Bacillota bacterium]